MKRTKLMSRLFSEDCDQQFKEKVLAAIDEAHENGESDIKCEDCDLHFADVDGDVIVEDQENDNEVTRFSENPEDENDLVMEAVDVDKELDENQEMNEAEGAAAAAEEENPENDIESEDEKDLPEESEENHEEEEEKEFSEGLDKSPSIEIHVLNGPDGDHAEDIVEDFQCDVYNGIDDEEKSGTKEFSLRFKNFSMSKARKYVKLFSELLSPIDDIVDSANVDEDIDVKVNEDGELKVMSLKYGKKGVRIYSDMDAVEVVPTPAEEPKKEEEGEVVTDPVGIPKVEKTFSEGGNEDPKVTVTVEGLEPASVASLLTPVGKSSDDVRPSDDVEPKVDPNEEGNEYSRKFSSVSSKKSCNPLLFVEIK